MPNTTVYLKNYQPPNFKITSVHLDFDLNDDRVIVTNRMNLVREQTGPLRLHGDELELLQIEMDGKPLEEDAYHLENSDLILEHCSDTFDLKIVTAIYPQNNTKLSGLYRSQQLFCTQCEAEGFRRITFFLDRPDVLTIYTTRISADKSRYPVLLSNGNLLDSGELPNGRHWVEWHDPFKKPSYLFALVAGQLACVDDEFTTCSGKKVDLKLYVEPGNEDYCAHAMESLKKAMRWDEEKYGREYDLSIFMIVAVSDFNMGAMENKGLNIFNSKCILARPDVATDQDFLGIESVVAHEYFHNWTGNRVTCRDWFQLSLKEGLTVFRDQEFSRDMNSRDVNRIEDVKQLLNAQFPEDASKLAHPVRPNSYQEINNFYTATIYEKGAEVIRMQHTLLGEQRFRRGMDLYFQRHDGQAVTINDFVAAMEDANGIDLTQFKHWYSQAGTPEVIVESTYQDDCLTLTLTQTCPPTPECQTKKPFHIPIRIALFDSTGQPIPLEQELLELCEPHQRFEFQNLTTRPVVSLLRGFSAPIKLKQSLSQDEYLTLLRFESDGYAKWNAARQLSLQMINGYFNLSPNEWHITGELIDAYRHVLEDHSLDYALRAELLIPPSYEDVVACQTHVDVDKLEAARDFFRSALGKALFESLLQTYNRLWQEEDHTMNSNAYGRRKLRNNCLWLMMKGNEERALSSCQEQFNSAQTMTDQITSLALLNNSKETQLGESALNSFYQQWSKNELVLDKWFAIQACCELPSTLEHVKSLLTHPAFNLKNPNKVRALIGTFCQANPRHFHALDGSGYRFLAEMLIKVDQLNPQIASRLATPFTRWQRLDSQRQALMKEELSKLLAQNLSRDLHEVISKSYG